jgi:hypothetical protein
LDISLVKEYGKRIGLHADDIDYVLAKFGGSKTVYDLDDPTIEQIIGSNAAIFRMRNSLAEKGYEFTPLDLFLILNLFYYMRTLLRQERKDGNVL